MPHPANEPPIADAPLSMALPVHAGQAILAERAAPAWVTALSKLDRPFELLLIDDGCAEGDANRLATMAEKHREIILLRHETPKGVGASLKTALANAKHPLFFYSALDYPYQTTDLRKLLEHIDDVDLVSGFRAARKPPDGYRTFRRVTNILLRVLIGLKSEPAPGWLGGRVHLYNRLMRTVFGQQLDDVESAYKLARREVLDRMVLQSDGPFIHTEIIAKASFMTLWLDEVPIGAQGGVPPAALQIPLDMRTRWGDLRRLLSRPDFGKWTPPATQPEIAQPPTV